MGKKNALRKTKEEPIQLVSWSDEYICKCKERGQSYNSAIEEVATEALKEAFDIVKNSPEGTYSDDEAGQLMHDSVNYRVDKASAFVRSVLGDTLQSAILARMIEVDQIVYQNMLIAFNQLIKDDSIVGAIGLKKIHEQFSESMFYERIIKDWLCIGEYAPVSNGGRVVNGFIGWANHRVEQQYAIDDKMAQMYALFLNNPEYFKNETIIEMARELFKNMYKAALTYLYERRFNHEFKINSNWMSRVMTDYNKDSRTIYSMSMETIDSIINGCDYILDQLFNYIMNMLMATSTMDVGKTVDAVHIAAQEALLKNNEQQDDFPSEEGVKIINF